MKYSSFGGNKTRVTSFFVTVCFLTYVAASAFVSRAYAMNESRASSLAPGSYIWNPSLATDGLLSMRVRLASQTAFVYRGDTLIGITSIASGKPGYETPDGTFTVLEKERFHHSNKYDNAPMPFMQRLTWYGLALHGGHPHGYPASHGCIRLPMGFAAALFKADTRGMEVVIMGHAPGRGQARIASRQRTRSRVQDDDLRSAEFPDEQDESAASPGAVPDRTGNGEAGDDIDDRGNIGDVYRSPDPDANRYPDLYRDRNQREPNPEPPQEIPPPDLPPPPG